MAIFYFSRWRPSAILDFLKFQNYNCVPFWRAICVIVPNFLSNRCGDIVLPAASVRRANMPSPCQTSCRLGRDMAIFHFFKMVAVRHFGFSKFKMLTAGPVQRANMHHRAKFCANRSNSSRDMAVFRCFIMRPSAIFNLFYVFRPPTKRIWCSATVQQVAQLSLTNPRDALHHDKRKNFKTFTRPQPRPISS